MAANVGLPQTFQPGSAAAPSTQVEISVSCRNLQDRDAFSKSDPVCILFNKDIRTNTYYEFGRTEMIKDTLNPEFVKKFVVHYFFEESQKLKFEIYDVDSPSQRLDAHDFLGRIECTLGEIVGSSGGKLERPLLGCQKTHKGSNIIVRTEEVSTCKEIATMQFRATGLDKKDFLGKSDPFLIIYRANEDNSFTAVHKTEVIKNNLNPSWRLFTIPVCSLCNGDYDRTIKIECFDWDSDGSCSTPLRSGSHDLIGEFSTNLREMSKASTQNVTWPVINPKKKAKKKNYKHSGEVKLMSCKLETQPSFLDFVRGGTELNFTVAIDFTASNGNPSQSSSLHYVHPQQPNQYISAIQAVGEIIQDYDSDKMFPVLGFGAKLPDGSVSHEFFVNFDPTNPYCQGIHGILDAYQSAIRRVQLYGPTNFSPVINHVARFAGSSQDGSHYFVLLIITDGVITDMANTVESIVNASRLPMSIIIVGVGNDSFEAMDMLDADNHRLNSNGKYADRDIVQFVPFREFVGGQFGSNVQVSQAALAKEVLAEVPDQVISYMKKHGIKPRPPRDGVQLPTGTGAPAQRPAAPQRPPGPPGGQPQWQGAPPPQGSQQQWAGVPPQQQIQGAPLQGNPSQQWQGAPQGSPYQSRGPPPQASSSNQHQLQGVPPQQQIQGAPLQGNPSQQWQGAPQGSPYHSHGPPPQASSSNQHQLQGVPPQQQIQGAPLQGNPSQQWQGAPQGSPYQSHGPPPQASSSNQHQWQGAPSFHGGPAQPQWKGAPPTGAAPPYPQQPPYCNPSAPPP